MDKVVRLDLSLPIIVGDGINEYLMTIDGVEQTERYQPKMIRYSQRDPRWRDYEYAPGITLGGYGCYLTCVAMVANLAGYNDDPQDIALKLKAAGAMNGAYLAFPERIPRVYEQLVWRGVLDWRKRPADLIRLRQEMGRWDCAIVEVEFNPGGAQPPDDQHFVLALRFTDDGRDLVIADPWDGAETRLMERYALDHWDLARAVYGARLLSPVDN